MGTTIQRDRQDVHVPGADRDERRGPVADRRRVTRTDRRSTGGTPLAQREPPKSHQLNREVHSTSSERV